MRSMHARKRVTVLLLFCLALFAVHVRAQEEEPGKDHPSVPRFPGMAMYESDQTDFDGFDFPVDPVDCSENKTKRVEGRSWRLVYGLKEGARKPSPLEIVRNYTNQFKARGGRVVCQVVEGTGQGWATLTMPLGQGERWLYLYVRDEATTYTMRIIETAAMKQKVEFSADEMAEEIKKSGHVAIYGINFDIGKATIKPESQTVLSEIVKLLNNNSDWKLRVEGHTDNVGAKAANQRLSEQRAAAVVAWLAEHGVGRARLTPQGFGDTKPVADNNTEEGRAKNRRVELAKQ